MSAEVTARVGEELGEGAPRARRAVIVCSPDDFANGVRPNELAKFLERAGYRVDMFDTTYLSRLGSRGLARTLPGLSFRKTLLYVCSGVYMLACKQQNLWVRKVATSAVMRRIVRVRGQLLARLLRNQRYDLLICERCVDEAVVEAKVASIQILDLPVPYAEELYYGGELTRRAYRSLVAEEARAYRSADRIGFHWPTYTDFVEQNKCAGDNFIRLGYGVADRAVHATYSEPPRVVFLGLLEGYWINLALLEELSSKYPIEVFGAPTPHGYRLNYKGYAPSLDVLADYQFGLITITDDPLRRSSFSSKQLDYYSYGLPVLTPEWRRDATLDPGAITFNAENFTARIAEYADRGKWTEKSDAALAIVRQLTWTTAFDPLREVLSRNLR